MACPDGDAEQETKMWASRKKRRRRIEARLNTGVRGCGGMATGKQIAANRANAKQSTGPKTQRGRQASSRNALRHGLSLPEADRSFPINVDVLAEVLVCGEDSELQLIAARQLAQAHLDLIRVRAVRATLLASLHRHAWPSGDLRRLLALDRYERVARGRRRRAAQRLLSE
jgi:hypothetical protein